MQMGSLHHPMGMQSLFGLFGYCIQAAVPVRASSARRYHKRELALSSQPTHYLNLEGRMLIFCSISCCTKVEAMELYSRGLSLQHSKLLQTLLRKSQLETGLAALKNNSPGATHAAW